MKIYCEPGALSRELKKLQREGRVQLIHFPYDPDLRSRHVVPSATPSAAQWRDMNLAWSELGQTTWADMRASPQLPAIQSIIGSSHRRDALHIDSAVKTGCLAFVTSDTDILAHAGALEALLGIRFFSPDRDMAALREFVESLEH